jgi:hypothetical protein
MEARLGVVTAWFALNAVAAAPASDEIPVLPGWEQSLPSKWYSGYIDISGAMGYKMMRLEHLFS